MPPYYFLLSYFTLLFTDLRDRKAMHLPESHFRMKAKNAINTSSAAKRMLTDQEPRRYGCLLYTSDAADE